MAAKKARGHITGSCIVLRLLRLFAAISLHRRNCGALTIAP
jgi:hypothetical protein